MGDVCVAWHGARIRSARGGASCRQRISVLLDKRFFKETFFVGRKEQSQKPSDWPSSAGPCDTHSAVPSSPTVNPKRASDGQASATTTLGDLLYSDRSATPIPEDEWVNLVQSIAAGEQPALRSLYQRTHRLVFTLAVRICLNREIAEEVTLDVFHDVWRRSVDYDPAGGTVLGWIMNQARSRAIDRLRFEQRKKRVPPSPDHRDEPLDTPGPAETIVAQQRRDRLQAALTELTPDERAAIETAYFSELTYSETALRLDQPLGTVKTRVRSALAKLRKALASEGGRS